MAEAVGCRGLARARELLDEDGAPSHAEIGARFSVGPFGKPIPAAIPRMIRDFDAILDLAMEEDPRTLDAPEVVTNAGGVPLLLGPRCRMLDELSARSNDPEARRLMKYAAAIEDHLRWLRSAWDSRRRAVFEAMRSAELLAADRLYLFLAANQRVVASERARYVRAGGPGSDRANLWSVVRQLGELRASIDTGAMERAELWSDCVAVGMAVEAFAGSFARGDPTIDDIAWGEVAEAFQATSEKHRVLTKAIGRYLKARRVAAARFPVVLIMDCAALRTAKHPDDTAAAAQRALDRADEAIDTLLVQSVRNPLLGARRTSRDVALGDLATRIHEAPVTSVWKLPAFMDAACNALPTGEMNVVRRMRMAAQDADMSGARLAGLAYGGVDLAVGLANLTGVGGIVLALVFSLVSMGRNIYAEQQSDALFYASLTPETLLYEAPGEEDRVEVEASGSTGIYWDLIMMAASAWPVRTR